MSTRVKRTHRSLARAATGAVAILALSTVAACGGGDSSDGGGGGDEDGPTTITIAEQSTAGMTTGLWPHLAEDLGYLEEEGIEIGEYIAVTEPSAAITGMQSGSVQISHIGVDGLVAAAKGNDIVGLAALTDASIWTVISSPDVDEWSDLRGKTIALGSLSDITRVIFDQLAEQAGLDPATDLEYVALGSTPDRLAAVQNGQAAATIATFPPAHDVLARSDLNDLGFAPEGTDVPRFIITEIAASQEWAEANPEVAEGYLRAVTRAVEYARDPENLDDVVERISRLSDTSPEAVQKGLEVYLTDPTAENAYFPSDFNHGDDAFENTVDAYVDLGIIEEPISEDDYMDYSYVEAALSQ